MVGVLLGCCATMPGSCAWVVARSSHFDVYSEAGPERAQSALIWFEELKTIFEKNGVVTDGIRPQNSRPVQVIGFRSAKEYNAFRTRMTADAYYVGAEGKDYIVMPALEPREFGVAAHEYAHFLLHSRGLRVPAWIDEGLAEVFATVRITNRKRELGGPSPMRLETLRRRAWVPLPELFDPKSSSVLRQTREGSAIFYAESWAVTDLLTFSPIYAPQFHHFIGALNAGLSPSQAFAAVYGKTIEAVLGDLRMWVRDGMSQRKRLPSSAPGRFDVKENELSEFQSSMLLADLLFVQGDWNRAEEGYHRLLQKVPNNPEILAALGTIAFRRGESRNAIEWWGKAIDEGESEAWVCFRYAVLADAAGLPPNEIKRALERAVASKPGFDDARYQLAILESNSGEYDNAVAQLRRMTKPSPQRAYGYWSTMAYALTELDKRKEAEDAARQALKYAATDENRAKATAMLQIARTDLRVQYSRDASGHLQLVTTRAPHDDTDWNPFVESGDDIRQENGQLRGVQCHDGKLTGLVVTTKNGSLTLLVPDPSHVLMQNSPAEFTCGSQTPASVRVDYAQSTQKSVGILRRMEFH